MYNIWGLIGSFLIGLVMGGVGIVAVFLGFLEYVNPTDEVRREIH